MTYPPYPRPPKRPSTSEAPSTWYIYQAGISEYVATTEMTDTEWLMLLSNPEQLMVLDLQGASPKGTDDIFIWSPEKRMLIQLQIRGYAAFELVVNCLYLAGKPVYWSESNVPANGFNLVTLESPPVFKTGEEAEEWMNKRL